MLRSEEGSDTCVTAFLSTPSSLSHVSVMLAVPSGMVAWPCRGPPPLPAV